MDTQALAQTLQQLAAAQGVFAQHAAFLSALVVALVIITLVGFVALFFELRSMRQMLGHIQASAEHIAEMTRDVLRRVS